MFIKALKSKIHRARVTDTRLDYPGSLEVDSELLEEAGLAAYEAILMANVTNGSRAETYVIPGKAGGREVVVLGAAARIFNKDDVIILINFGYYSPEELSGHKPTVIALDENNEIILRK